LALAAKEYCGRRVPGHGRYWVTPSVMAILREEYEQQKTRGLSESQHCRRQSKQGLLHDQIVVPRLKSGSFLPARQAQKLRSGLPICSCSAGSSTAPASRLAAAAQNRWGLNDSCGQNGPLPEGEGITTSRPPCRRLSDAASMWRHPVPGNFNQRPTPARSPIRTATPLSMTKGGRLGEDGGPRKTGVTIFGLADRPRPPDRRRWPAHFKKHAAPL